MMREASSGTRQPGVPQARDGVSRGRSPAAGPPPVTPAEESPQ